MKKLFFLPLLLIAAARIGFSQCTPLPPTGTQYFYPPADSFPCVVRGEPFAANIFFEVPDTISQIFGGDRWTIDSITGLPGGISYQINPKDTFTGGETGCIDIFGITNEAQGVDSLYVYVTISVPVVGMVESAEIGSFNGLEIPGGTSMGERYYIEVVEPGTACSSPGGSFVNLISGSVFYDINSNGAFDSTDSKMANVPIEINPGQVAGFTRQDGNYYVYADTGNYIVSITPPANYRVSGVSSYNITTSGSAQVFTGNDFGLYPTMLINDLSVTLTTGFARPGFLTTNWIHYQNIGTSIQSGTISYVYDPALSFLSSTETPASLNANNISWSFTNLYPGQQRSIHIQLQVPANTSLIGDTLLSSVNLPVPRDTNLLNNKDNEAQIVTGSYDPNDKLVSPDDVKNGVHPSQPLTYTVRFQNTGTDTAFTIVVRDTLDDYLNASSFQTIAASHPYSFQLEGSKYAIWTFDNILLPDSGIDEPSSHGFVKFSINIKSNAPHQTIIENSASIYFDFNPPIHTNSVQARVDLTSGIRERELLSTSVFPNPIANTFTLTLSRPVADFDVQLLDFSGRIIQSQTGFSGNKAFIDVGELENGIYLYRISQSDKYIARGKLAVLR